MRVVTSYWIAERRGDDQGTWHPGPPIEVHYDPAAAHLALQALRVRVPAVALFRIETECDDG